MKTLIIYHKNHDYGFLTKIQAILKKNKVPFSTIERGRMNEKKYLNKKLIIVIGGDGTFLRAAHLNKNVPMFGVNPYPVKKEGFFMQADPTNYGKKLEAALKGKFKTINLLRLGVKINNRQLKVLALNEVSIGDAKHYNMFNYDLIIGQKKEFQRSSGLLIGTPAGSYAWLKSAGGKEMKLTENKFQFVARELYEGRIANNYKLKKGILKNSQKIKIICRSAGTIVLDSLLPDYDLKKGDKVLVCPSKDYLPYIKITH
jgi:NAD kinase